MFVQGALSNERVKIKAVKVGKSYGYGKLLEIKNSSPYRQKPLCPYFGRCGGCQLQHLSYPAQLKFKRKLVQDALQRIGGIQDVSVNETIGMDEPWNYRNKMQFPVGMYKDNLAIGFYAPRSHDIIDMNQCNIHHEINDKIIEVIRGYINKFHIQPYNEQKHEGIIRHIVSKTGFKSGEVMVIIVTNGKELPHKDELVKSLTENIPGIKSIVQNINSRQTNVILGDQNRVLWGKDHIYDYIGDLKFKISPLSFFQVNPVQTEILYKKAVEYAGLTGKETIIDAYCGIGTISLFMARKAAKVLGVEVVSQAIEDAKQNAKENGIENVEFQCGDAEVLIPELFKKGMHPDVIVVDPPRKGCSEKLLEAMAQAQPDRIVYVSCNPATLARDLSYLNKNGYKVEEVQPVDMFAQSVHVECVVLMSRL
jgi:23S rRNA (uracil1939-C5)-methyltransferase